MDCILFADRDALRAEETVTPQVKKTQKTSPQFLRLTRDSNRTPLTLETAVVRYTSSHEKNSDLTVDLVAAIHIADKSYYQQINRELKTYDAVLYELVATEESKTPHPNDRESHHPLSLVQNGMKDLLGLEFQLKGIDYTCNNMIHADMSPDQFAQSMQQRGESLTTMFVRMVGYALARQNAANGQQSSQILLAFFDKNRTLKLKRIVAEEFEDGEDSMAALEGPTGSTLITGRNQVALEVLRKEIAAGKKKIAIFYGAAHMPDFQKHLQAEFGLAPTDTRWLVAWNLKSE